MLIHTLIFLPFLERLSYALIPPILLKVFIMWLIFHIALVKNLISVNYQLASTLILTFLTITISSLLNNSNITITIIQCITFLLIYFESRILSSYNLKLNEKFIFILIITVGTLGILDMFQIISLGGRNYQHGFNASGINLLRLTSVFNEPSSAGLFFIVTFICGLSLNSNRILFFSLIFIVLTQSLESIFVIIAIILVNQKINYKKSIITFATLFFIIIFTGIDDILFARLSQLEIGSSHRTETPIILMQILFVDQPSFLNIMFGMGLESINSHSHKFLEQIGTSHNYLIDILFEQGISGLIIFTFAYFTFLKNSYKYFLLLMVLSLTTGYRSTLTFALFALIYTLKNNYENISHK